MVKKRKKSKKFIKIKGLLVLFWLIVCASLGLFLPQIPVINNLIKIEKVEIEGYKEIDKKAIKRLFEKESWIFIRKNKIEENIKKQFPQIQEVSIRVIKPKVVKVKLTKRTPLAILKFKKRTYVLDNNFQIISLKYFKQEDLKNIKYEILYNDLMVNKIDKRIIKNIEKIDKNFNYFNIKKYIINISQIACILENGKTLVFSKENLNKSIKRAKSFFNKVDISKYKYIDFSFDSIVVARR